MVSVNANKKYFMELKALEIVSIPKLCRIQKHKDQPLHTSNKDNEPVLLNDLVSDYADVFM